MIEADLENSEYGAEQPGRGWRRKRILFSLGLGGALALALLVAWLSREEIAEDFINDELRANGLPATYEIERIGGQQQILRNLVIGDPARPDFTAERVEVRIAYRLGAPQIGRITLVRPRIFGRLKDGRVSFGSLDRVLYRDSGKPPGLPEIDLALRDGRALIRTPHGPIGGKIDGEGLVSSGFSGTLALAAPALAIAECRLAGVSLYGRITTKSGEPSFAGPVRAASLGCADRRIAVGRVDADLRATLDRRLEAASGRASLAAGPLGFARYGANGADGTLRWNWKDGLFDARHTVALRGVTTPQALAAIVTAEGTFRAENGFTRLSLRSDLEGNGLRPGPAFGDGLQRLARAGEGTMLNPLARRFAGALARQARGSAFRGDVAVRHRRGVTSLSIPQAELTGGSGARILSLSRVQGRIGGGGAPRFAGNIATGGPDMPQISGRMEGGAGGAAVFRLAMQPYSAGQAAIAIPQLSVVQSDSGALGFSGRVVASGPLPGGHAEGLSLPVSGRWVPGGALALWRSCVDIGFQSLRIARLNLTQRSLRLCPREGRAIVENGRGGLRIAAGAPRLDLAGSLGETPIRLSSGPVGFAWPGVLAARSVDIALGPPDTASRFAITNLAADLGGESIAGRFDGADIRLARVPLDLRDASGGWRYAGGVLTLGEAAFRLLDRSPDARFEPLIARDGTLTLRDNVITAEARLRNPATDRVVTDVNIVHDLGNARGYADLSVPGLVFDRDLQPEALSRRALGVIANASGTITGTGRIDWNGDGVTSTGDFASEGLDFAAAFGPVKVAWGTVHFTDLIGLDTAPGQTISVASVNPGIEVSDGEFTFQLRGGRMLAVEGGSWPFMGGRLTLRSVDLNFGTRELRRYVFEIEGLDAAAFIARFELPNLAATGRFDGVIPIVFDENGNGRIEGGTLRSRLPGGNISYVGDLTFKDLSPMANFAFDALRSLDYQQMDIAMTGSLTGEIVTNVRFDGVRQGAGAKRNVITRALARLPIQFKINITAPFYQLITSFKALRDPAAVRDPRDLGLLSDDGSRLLKPEVTADEVKPAVRPEDLIPGSIPRSDP